MQHLITSQMSLTKLRMNMLTIVFQPPEKPVANLVLEFLKPFNHLIEQKNLFVQVIEANEIPSLACCDWDKF